MREVECPVCANDAADCWWPDAECCPREISGHWAMTPWAEFERRCGCWHRYLEVKSVFAELNALYDIEDEAALVRAIVELLNEDDWELNTAQWRDLFDRFPPAIEAGVNAYNRDVWAIETNLRGLLASGFVSVDKFKAALDGLVAAGLMSPGGRTLTISECTRKGTK